MPDISGNYEGEGVNVTGAQKQTLVPDVGQAGNKGPTSMVRITRRRQLAVSSESARSDAAISYGGGDQILTVCSRGVYITTGGTLVLRLVESTADQTYSALIAGNYYPFQIAIVRQAASTAAGILLF
jgi:hypothetical protein